NWIEMNKMNPFRALHFSPIIICLALTIVTCFSPEPRVGPASVLNGNKIYFFGGNTKNPSIFRINPFGVLICDKPQPAKSPLILNNQLYILNTQNYTWVNTFDASNIYGSNSLHGSNVTSNNDSGGSISLGAIIGIGVGAAVALIIIGVVGFFGYKRIHARDNRHSIATPGTLYTEYMEKSSHYS
ncbi:16067_t:CDS:2, partial [Cetraspora pellucida]